MPRQNPVTPAARLPHTFPGGVSRVPPQAGNTWPGRTRPSGKPGGCMTEGEIAAMFEHAWQTTTRHLRVLETAGLLSHEKQGRTRIYRIQRKRL